MRDNKEEFKHDRLFRGVAKIPTSRTLNILADVDFLGGGGFTDSAHIGDISPKYPMLASVGTRKKRSQSAEKAARIALANLISFSWRRIPL